MKTLLKLLNWAEWAFAGIGIVFLLLALVQAKLTGRFSADTEIVNYFHAANSFFLLTIVTFLFIHFGQFNKNRSKS